MCIIREEEAAHSLSSDLGSLINDEKSSDLILQAGERYGTERDRERIGEETNDIPNIMNIHEYLSSRRFMVHQNILAARSPVFADLLARMESDIQEYIPS